MPMRITGMSSGMDIDSIIKDLMKAEKIPQTKMQQKKDLLNFQTALLREVNTKMSTLRESLNAMRYSSNLTGTKATASSGEITPTVSSNTSKNSYSLEVIALATSASSANNQKVTNMGLVGNDYATSTITQGINDQLIVTVDNQARMITLKPGTYDIDGMKSELQSSLDKAFGGRKVTVGVDTGATKLTLESASNLVSKPQIIVNEGNGAMAALGFEESQSYRLDLNMKLSDLATSGKLKSPLQIPGGTDKYEFEVNGAKITYDGNSTLQSIMNQVNSSSANVTMSYDTNSDTFVFKSRTMGATSEVNLVDGSGKFLEAIGVTELNAKGQDAQIIIDGKSLTKSSNNFTEDGITYQLNKTTSAPVTVTIAADAGAVVDKVKKFVTSYNDMMELINTRLGETKERGYSPLTADEKSAMSDTDIATWESKVKVGLINNSSILKEAKNNLRGLLSKTVDGLADEFNTLSEIGITTAPYVKGNIKDAGKIILDETKLQNAIAKDANAVNKLFTNNPGFESQEGIAVTMYKKVDSILSDLIKESGRVGGSTSDVSTKLGKMIYQLDDKMAAMVTLLNKKEDNYYKRFSAMETAIANANSQSAWLSQQFG